MGGGPAFAPWLGAVGLGAVASTIAMPYVGRDARRPDVVVWREGGQEVSAKVNMVTVREDEGSRLCWKPPRLMLIRMRQGSARRIVQR